MSAATEAGLLFFAVALGTAALTAAMRWLARRLDFVSRPRAGRWNARTVPLGGGIPMVMGMLAGLALLESRLILAFGPPLLLIFALGLIDDLRGVAPAGKLVVQAIAASYLVSLGTVLPLPWEIIAIPLTMVWVVGATNAVNLLDNMDGLAAGVAMVAALGLALLLFVQGDLQAALLGLVVAAAAAGFLVHNFAPARIFMGDAGSLSLGFVLAALATRLELPALIPWYGRLALAVLPLAVPIFDTLLVTYTRRRVGRPFLLGGRDHSSHRLVALGLSERRAVLLLYALGLAAAAAALLGSHGGLGSALVAVAVTLIVFILFGVFLSEAAVDDSLVARQGEGEAGLARRRTQPDVVLYIAEVLVDIAVIAVVWMGAHLIRFQDEGPQVILDYMRLSVIPWLPLLIAVKLAVFFIFELYRGIWRSISVRDVSLIFKAASLGTLILVLASALSTRLQDLSRVVIVIDWLLTFLAVLGTRAAIRAFRSWSTHLAADPVRVALLGPVSLSSVAERSISDENLRFTGVIATDNEPGGGEKVLGAAEQIEDIVSQQAIAVLLVATNAYEAPLQRLAERGILIRRARLDFE